jgi:hypothetical protein
MGVKTKHFGPPTWKVLHALAAHLDQHPAPPALLEEFFCHLSFVLPCVYCRLSYRQFVNQHPHLQINQAATNVSRFVYTLHNRVTQKLYSQEVASAGNQRDLIKAKWDRYVPSFSEAVARALPLDDPLFKNALLLFLTYILCDGENVKTEQAHIRRFLELLGLLIKGPLPSALEATAGLWQPTMNLEQRMDIIWALQKRLQWNTFQSFQHLMDTAKASIVGCL